MKETNTLLNVENLTVKRGQTILRNINWQVKKGEHWAILGENGSGKTTLVNTLLAYMPVTSGKIELCSQEYGKYDWREIRHQIGYVSSSLLLRMNQNMKIMDMIISGKKAELNYCSQYSSSDYANALKKLKDLGCEYIKDSYWYHLSQGEKQKVMIARALLNDVKVLILDEPCAGLDPIARIKFIEFLNYLSTDEKSPTILLITHHIDEIFAGINQLLVLKNGEVFYSGNTEKLNDLHFVHSIYSGQSSSIDSSFLKEYYPHFLDSLKDPFLFVDMNHRICYMNRSAINKFSEGEKLIGESIFSCHNSKSNEMIKEIFNKFKNGLEEQLISETDQQRVFMRSVRDPSNRLIGYYERYEKKS